MSDRNTRGHGTSRRVRNELIILFVSAASKIEGFCYCAPVGGMAGAHTHTQGNAPV
jgi:hypothetical protein